MKKDTDLPIGTSVYTVIRYPSGIHRVQRLVAGANGRFLTKYDGNPMLAGSWRIPCFFGYEEALEESRLQNEVSLLHFKQLADGYLRRADNVYCYLHGVRR